MFSYATGCSVSNDQRWVFVADPGAFKLYKVDVTAPEPVTPVLLATSTDQAGLGTVGGRAPQTLLLLPGFALQALLVAFLLLSSVMCC